MPTFYTALRGLCYFHVRVRTGSATSTRALFGGAALNAMHALMQTLSGVLPRDGRVPEPLRAGIARRRREELESWKTLTPGSEMLARPAPSPSTTRPAEEFYIRTWAEPAVDVHGLAGGSPDLVKTVLPVEARANVSIRHRAGPERRRDRARRSSGSCARRRPRAPSWRSSSSRRASRRWCRRTLPRSTLAREAFEQVLGNSRCSSASAARSRVAERIVAQGIPAIITGIATRDANVHSPNEKFPATYLAPRRRRRPRDLPPAGGAW